MKKQVDASSYTTSRGTTSEFLDMVQQADIEKLGVEFVVPLAYLI